MSYYRTAFESFEEFKREGSFGDDLFGHEELELLHELEEEEAVDRPRRRRDWE